MNDKQRKVIDDATLCLERTHRRRKNALAELDFCVNTGDFAKADTIRRGLLLLAACEHVYELTIKGKFHKAAKAYRSYESTFKLEFTTQDDNQGHD